jgi:two-component system, NtrC family, nitrogen regulation sensor histidine kinase NtrY
MSAESPAIEAATVANSEIRRPSFELSRWIRAAGYVAVVLALSAAAVTFFVLLGLTPIEPTPDVIFNALLVNGALVAFLVFVVGWELGRLLLARRRGRAAARLHIRVVALFSVVAAIPAILVAIVASITLDRGLDNWFSTRMQSIIGTSQSIARAYVDQQAQIMRGDILGLKIDFERARHTLVESPGRFQAFIESSAASRRIPAIFLVNGNGELITQSQAAAQGSYPPLPDGALSDAKQDAGQPILIAPGNTPDTANVIGGVVELAGYTDVFLYVARKVDPDVVRYISLIEATSNDYSKLEASRFGVQVAFGILYLGVSVIVLLSAIWIGLAFANWLVSPIRRLIDAAKEVSRGNLDVAVSVKASEGDLGALSDTFNTMTSQLRGQRSELVLASEQIDSRRRFTEAVLSGVPAGVIGIDAQGCITIANRTALQLLGVTSTEAIGKPVKDTLPQLGLIVDTALRENRVEYREQIVVSRAGRERTINVRLTTESEGAHGHGYVVTLDDITDLVTAQRSTAWADVARRIAHEIKNPLTPIQLSAERLRRKFGRAIVEDREIFDQCTDTIVRQVGDIGRMVDEFSDFARMPKPTIESRNLSDSIREAVFLLEVAQPDISFEVDVPEEPLIGRFDSRLMGQALTNIVKNATEAVAAATTREEPGLIRIVARIEGESIVVDVIDNGVGLPQEGRRRLLEPYMTTREKGTGLGLAIVTKIIEEHGGKIDLLDAPETHSAGRGALVRITLPRAATPAEQTPAADNKPLPAVPATQES